MTRCRDVLVWLLQCSRTHLSLQQSHDIAELLPCQGSIHVSCVSLVLEESDEGRGGKGGDAP